MSALLTGATGFLGSEVLPRWLAARPGERVHCVVRAASEAELAERRRGLLEWARVPEGERERVVLHAGDLTAPDLGLGAGYDALARELDTLLHAAACTRFDLPLEDARRTNVTGLSNLLALARRARELGRRPRIHHVSTAFAVGRDPASGEGRAFRNSYERSKWEAETLLRREAEGLPWTIYRPSIIVGDSRTGRTPHFRVLYEPAKWIALGRLRLLPCRPEVRLDVVPVDWVADAITALAAEGGATGEVLRLTCGREKAIRIGELIEGGLAAANALLREQGREELERPLVVTPEGIASAPPAERERLEKAWEGVRRAVDAFLPYMLEEQTFEPEGLPPALRDACPPLRDYVPAVIGYAVANEFRDRGVAPR